MEINKLSKSAIPERLQQIGSPPKQLYSIGAPLEELLLHPTVGIVGSRKVSTYGREVTARLGRELAELGVVIVSGLAFGVDSIAHQAALDAGGLTIAVLPGPIEKIYPASHRQLAANIVKRGGALVSEYPTGTEPFPANFIARNRIISGLSDTLLVTEAALKSGSLHTAHFALEQGKDVLAVPGNISSPTSVGTNNLLKSGATPVTGLEDILYTLGLELATHRTIRGSNEHEQAILDLLASSITDGEALLAQSNLEVEIFNQTLTMLEITGKIRAVGGNNWSVT